MKFDVLTMKFDTTIFDDATIVAMRFEDMQKLMKIVAAAQSVLSEESVRETLLSYVMGTELINLIDSIPE